MNYIKFTFHLLLVTFTVFSITSCDGDTIEDVLPPDYVDPNEKPDDSDEEDDDTVIIAYDYIIPQVDVNGRIIVSGNPPLYTDTASYHVVSVAYDIDNNKPFDIETYYASAIGKKGDALKAAIASIITDNYQAVSYGDARYIMEKADNDPVSGRTWCFYQEMTGNPTWDSGSTWNREHVWAQSRGLKQVGESSADNSTKGIASDVHNLKAENPGVNGIKSNRDFETKSDDANYFGVHGSYSYAPMVSARGDVARILMYMELRWADSKGLYLDDSSTNSTGSHDGGPARQGRVTNLIEWHSTDPVDPFEIRRNNIVFQHQNNRNPFVDHPELVDHIYGSKKDVAWDGGVVYSVN
ncbi:endonuclease [Saccharicrinis aurantiacus]|uniref:endonuclease n=1 Tax=Saccharicrinis aurantiacus TaxID=1849719 RepID=UPI00248FFF15|nr:endonuclease [Saccharicrinis aurantiacus]